MLPFLKRSQEASASTPVETVKRESDHEEEYDSLESAGEDLLHAIKTNDAKLIAEAIRSAFQIIESEHHEEGSEE